MGNQNKQNTTMRFEVQNTKDNIIFSSKGLISFEVYRINMTIVWVEKIPSHRVPSSKRRRNEFKCSMYLHLSKNQNPKFKG